MSKQSKELVSQMTIEEKASLCSGKDFWRLKEIPRLGIKSIMVADGPHGLRKQINEGDNLGIAQSYPAVCFPTASALACSFDRDLLYEVGETIAKEARSEKVSVVLGPGVNIKRSPLCGRNFEYFSEDPLVAGELAAAMINGIQSKKIGASLKHFAVNNQETRRMTVSAQVDERAFREIYLKPFEIAVKKSNPWTVMCAYNKIDGTYCSENKKLLTHILREEWGYEGVVVSDWGAVHKRELGILAGNDLEMPGNDGVNDKKIVEAVENEKIPPHTLGMVAENVLDLILKAEDALAEDYVCDLDLHHQKAIYASEESAVLLKNKNNILPATNNQRVAIIGEMAKSPRYQGTGSSKINPVKVDNAWDEICKMGVKAEYGDGKSVDYAKEISMGKDLVIVFVGMTDEYESEGFDRNNMSIPYEHNFLIDELAKVHENIIVVLSGGAPLELPWVNKVKAILLMYLGGEGGGSATANLLFGQKSPSGKLAESWPIRLEDNPSYKNFPGGRASVNYAESIYVGYRYYDKAKKEVLFPFGHGLSYTSFEYSDLKVDKDTVFVNVKNVGTVDAKETVLMFVCHENKKVFMAKKELKGFEKIYLNPGESKTVKFNLTKEDLQYFNIKINGWYTDPGDYKIIINNLETTISVENDEEEQPDYKQIAPAYFDLKEGDEIFTKENLEKLIGKSLPEINSKAKRPFTLDSNLEDVSRTITGKIVIKILKAILMKTFDGDDTTKNMMISGMLEMPLHSIKLMYKKQVTPVQIDGILELLNRHYIRGTKKILD